MLEALPVVNAYNDEILDVNINNIIENSDVQYDTESEVESDMNVVGDNNVFNDIENDSDIKNLEFDINVNTNQSSVLSDETTFKNVDNMETKDIDIKASNVLEITLADGEFVPDLTNNPNGYKTIVVKTTGNKKLVSTDYDRLRTSKIANIDLSQAKSDSIPAGAFENVKLTSFQFPQGVESIGDSAFSGCTGFNGQLVIPNSVTMIGDYAFNYCIGLTGNLVIPDSVTSVGIGAFWNCNGFNGNLVIPDSVTSIGDNAFNDCRGLTGNLVIPDSVVTIGYGAFYGCSGLTGNLVIPDSVTYIGGCAFSGCSGFTGDLVISNSIASIEVSTFYGCSGLTGDLVIPDSITSIGDYAFYGCSGLTGDLVIPDSVAAIGRDAFYNCINIHNFIYKTNESFSDINYRKNIFDALDINKTIIEMSYNFDTYGTWIENLDSKNIGKPVLKSEIPVVDGKSSLMSLYIPTPYKEENITVLKDGELYDLPTKTSDGKYLFDEEGSYSVTLTTDLGSTSNIDFEVAASINKPTISYKNNMVSIVDNGNSLGVTTDRIEYRLNGGEWKTYTGSFRVPDELVNGIDDVKVEARVVVKDKFSKITECFLTIPKAQIDVEDIIITQGDNFNELDYVTAIDIDGTDITGKVTVVSSDVNLNKPGEYTIVYRVEASNGYFTEKEIKVTILKRKQPPMLIADDVVIRKGDDINPLDFVSAVDGDGNDIDKSEIEIVDSDLDVSTPGKYRITYRIVDDNGLMSTKTISVTVKDDSVTNGDDEKSENKMPATGGVASSISLISFTTMLSGLYFIKKRKK